MKRALILGLLTAAITLSLGTVVAMAQSAAEAADMTCFWAGDVYQPGDTVTIGGTVMVCDGKTGTWAKLEESE